MSSGIHGELAPIDEPLWESVIPAWQSASGLADQSKSALVEALGFDTSEAGSLAESWRHRPEQRAYCTDAQEPDYARCLRAPIEK
ncbi:hypothetical protein [Paraburkholderia sp. XV]|uniref:hypothetical protein n=1 Tax=Paraburkholderia sp. XV TaxID=2831520 RepID=UPI001CD39916|nr:hypothetical protein [Paraburkholderia sp. XV]